MNQNPGTLPQNGWFMVGYFILFLKIWKYVSLSINMHKYIYINIYIHIYTYNYGSEWFGTILNDSIL